MFTDRDRNYVVLRFYTTRYLGRDHFGQSFVDLLARYGGNFIPDKWNTEERPKMDFGPKTYSDVLKEWSSNEEIHELYFFRRRPVSTEFIVTIKRFPRAKFNNFSAFVADNQFGDQARVDEFLRFAIDVGSAFRTDYGFVAQVSQERRQSASFTPAERLSGIYWANFFGRPYIEFFGREKLLATPCHEVRQISDDLILLLTADSPYRPEMLENDDEVNRVKAYLNQNAFAGPNFPDEPCSVPQFDFSDVRPPAAGEPEESPIERLRRIRLELESKGYEVIGESQSHLRLRGGDGSVVIVDLASGSISLDLTGEAL